MTGRRGNENEGAEEGGAEEGFTGRMRKGKGKGGTFFEIHAVTNISNESIFYMDMYSMLSQIKTKQRHSMYESSSSIAVQILQICIHIRSF